MKCPGDNFQSKKYWNMRETYSNNGKLTEIESVKNKEKKEKLIWIENAIFYIVGTSFFSIFSLHR